jgi:hypothetical protein
MIPNGFTIPDWNKGYPMIQIITVEEILVAKP